MTSKKNVKKEGMQVKEKILFKDCNRDRNRHLKKDKTLNLAGCKFKTVRWRNEVRQHISMMQEELPGVPQCAQVSSNTSWWYSISSSTTRGSCAVLASARRSAGCKVSKRGEA